MRIITERRLRAYAKEDSKSSKAILDWIRIVRVADWASFADVRKTFNHADVFREYVIFDLGGNKYRIIGKVEYQKHLVFIKDILTHAEYSFRKGESWKEKL